MSGSFREAGRPGRGRYRKTSTQAGRSRLGCLQVNSKTGTRSLGLFYFNNSTGDEPQKELTMWNDKESLFIEIQLQYQILNQINNMLQQEPNSAILQKSYDDNKKRIKELEAEYYKLD